VGGRTQLGEQGGRGGRERVGASCKKPPGCRCGLVAAFSAELQAQPGPPMRIKRGAVLTPAVPHTLVIVESPATRRGPSAAVLPKDFRVKRRWGTVRVSPQRPARFPAPQGREVGPTSALNKPKTSNTLYVGAEVTKRRLSRSSRRTLSRAFPSVCCWPQHEDREGRASAGTCSNSFSAEVFPVKGGCPFHEITKEAIAGPWTRPAKLEHGKLVQPRRPRRILDGWVG